MMFLCKYFISINLHSLIHWVLIEWMVFCLRQLSKNSINVLIPTLATRRYLSFGNIRLRTQSLKLSFDRFASVYLDLQVDIKISSKQVGCILDFACCLGHLNLINCLPHMNIPSCSNWSFLSFFAIIQGRLFHGKLKILTRRSCQHTRNPILIQWVLLKLDKAHILSKTFLQLLVCFFCMHFSPTLFAPFSYGSRLKSLYNLLRFL